MSKDVSILRQGLVNHYSCYETVIYTSMKGLTLIICCCVDDLGFFELVVSDFECCSIVIEKAPQPCSKLSPVRV